jgi:hypothetical protein
VEGKGLGRQGLPDRRRQGRIRHRRPQRRGNGGNWAEEGDAVTITWDTGWKTKIAKDGAGYKKTAYEGDAEKSSSAAEKVK